MVEPILFLILYTEETYVEQAYNDVSLLFSSTYEAEVIPGTKTTVLYQTVSSIDTEATLNSIDTASQAPTETFM